MSFAGDPAFIVSVWPFRSEISRQGPTQVIAPGCEVDDQHVAFFAPATSSTLQYSSRAVHDAWRSSSLDSRDASSPTSDPHPARVTASTETTTQFPTSGFIMMTPLRKRHAVEPRYLHGHRCG